MSLDPFSALLDIGGKIIDRVIPDPEAKRAANLELLKLAQTDGLAKLAAETDLAKAQIGVNAAEAASGDFFTRGWRPAVGWTCAGGLASQFLIGPFVTWGAAMMGRAVVFPQLDMGTLLTLLFGMLGLGSLRTVEKLNGAAR